MSLQGKTAIITGGVKNLGREIAKELAPLGADLALHYNSAQSKSQIAETEKILRKLNPDVKLRFYQGDLRTATGVDELFASVLKDFGKVDIVINTVGKVLKKAITEVSEEEYDEMAA